MSVQTLAASDQTPYVRETAYAFPKKLLLFAMLLTMASIIWMAGNSYYFYRIMSEQAPDDLSLSELSADLLHYNSLLTQTARMAALTGDLYWEKQYQSHTGMLENNRQLVLSALSARHSGDLVKDIAQARENLNKMEKDVFSSLRQGDVQAARTVIEGHAYTEAKLLYSGELNKLSGKLREESRARLTSRANNFFSTIYLVLIGGSVLLIAWYAALRGVRRWQKELESARNALAHRIEEKEQMERQMKDYLHRMEEVQAELIEARKRAEMEARITNLLKSVTATANRSSDVREAIETTLELICSFIGWPLGHAYVVDEEKNLLCPTNIWYASNRRHYKDFIAVTEKTFFKSGIGLPGQTWEKRAPVWIKIEPDEVNFPRLELLPDLDVKSGFAVPLIVKGRVAYVLEFFSTHGAEVGDALLTIMAESCNQLVRVIERQRNEVDLQHAKDLAVKASDAKSDFLANMSHEIRTPLNGVLGMLTLILDTELSKQQQEWIDIARQSAEGLLDIINDILDLSKIEAGQMVIESVLFNLHAAIEAVTDLLYVRTKAKGLKLLVQFSSGLPRQVIGDPLRLKQVIINLLGNALKFTESGHILIRAWHTGSEDIMLNIEVEDTGIGIPTDKLVYIFNKFSQAQESTTRKFGGTGLGLAICKNIVALMGGEIGVRSALGQGSVFRFTARLKCDPALAAMEQAPVTFADARALFFENYPPAREIIKGYFDNWGLRYDAVNAASALITSISEAAAANDPYHFLLIDADLPKDVWWTLIENIAAMPSARDLLIVLTTSPGVDLRRYDLQGHRVAGLLTKPLYPSQLFDMLAFLWQNRRRLPSIGVVTKSSMMQHVSALEDAGRGLSTETEFPGTHVLLVEDQPVNQLLMRTILEKMKCHVETARNGIEGLQKVKAFPYNIVFMDCQMPEMDGFEATREIRLFEEGKERHTPIVALTADAMLGDKEKCLKCGMDDYINKPVKPEKIRDMIATYGGSRKQD